MKLTTSTRLASLNNDKLSPEQTGLSSAQLNYKCRQRPGLKFSSLEACQARRTRAEENPKYIELFECKRCPGPLKLIDDVEDTLTNTESESHKTEEPSAKPEICKCGRGPVVIRKNGVSAGRCSQCMSDVAKTWPRGRKKSNMKNDAKSKDKATSLDTHVLLGLLKERKEEAEKVINNVIENGAFNGDKNISQAIVSFVRLTATIDIILKAELSVDVKKIG